MKRVSFLLLFFICAISQKSFAQLAEGDEFTRGNFTYTIRVVDGSLLWVSCRAANTSISGEITIPAYFSYSSGGEEYDIMNTYIDDNAFANCTGITKIVFGDDVGVDGVGDNIFKNCTNLKTIVWDNTDPFYEGTIGTGAFDGCTSLDTIFANSYGDNLSNNYKSLIKCIIDDYPSLLNRVEIYENLTWDTKRPTYINYGMDGGSVSIDGIAQIQFVLEKEPQKTENYTLMGDLENTGTYAFLNNNEDLNNRTGHNFAMMAVPYDYSNNNWGSWITSASTATPSRGQSFLVYTTNIDRSTQSEVSDEETIVAWNDIALDNDNFFRDFNVTINNQEAGTGAKWFALCNPYFCDLSLYKFYKKNSLKIQV